MKNMELTRDKIRQLIKEIEGKTKQITPDMIEKYVKRNMDDSSNEKDMIADVKKIVNRKFNDVEMFDKINSLLILRGHIEYLDDIINRKNIIKILGYFLIVLIPIVFFVSQYDSILEESEQNAINNEEERKKAIRKYQNKSSSRQIDTVSDTVKNAYKLCSVLDDSGVLSKPCDISGFGQSVEITAEMTGAEARMICKMYADKLKQEDMLFDYGWTLKVYSPYSGDNTIAVCKLPY